MTIYEQGETFSHWVTIRNNDGQKVDPASVKLYIYDPCDNTVLDNQSMTKSETGVYYYDHELNSSATYGKYRTKVETTASSSQIGIIRDEFFVMPWALESTIRSKMGLIEDKDISDDDLSNIAWSAYQHSLRELYSYHYEEKPNPNPDDGSGFDGSNTSFQTKYRPIGDITGDGVISGNTDECIADIDGWWKNENGSHNDLTVTVTNATNGEITITQTGGSAIPSSNEGVYISYWSKPEYYDEFLFREAVAYLASHYVNLRLKDRAHIDITDLNSNKSLIFKNPDRYYNEFRRIMRLIGTSTIGGV